MYDDSCYRDNDGKHVHTKFKVKSSQNLGEP